MHRDCGISWVSSLILLIGPSMVFVVGLARRGSTICFHLLWHKVELAVSTRLCLL